MKKIFNITLTAILCLTLFLTASAETVLISPNPSTQNKIEFTDVDRNSAEGQAIYKLVEAGILLGDGNGQFRPGDSITRAELTKIVNMIFNYTEPAEEGFSDVTEDDWYYNSVLIAKKAGYIVGFHDGTFRGEEKVSREQACTILCRVGNLYELPIDIKINDEVSGWALPFVKTVLSNSLMTLEEGGKFRATKDITRSEFSVTYSNFYVPKAPEEKYEVEATNKNGKVDLTFKLENGEMFVTLSDKFNLSALNVITVLVKKDGNAVSGMKVTVTDKNKNKVTLTTDKDGKIQAKVQIAGGGGGGGGSSSTGGNNNNNNNNNNDNNENEGDEEVDYSQENKSILDELSVAKTVLQRAINNEDHPFQFNEYAMKIIETLEDCLTDVQQYESTDLINEKFINKTYINQIKDISKWFDEIEKDSQNLKEFINAYIELPNGADESKAMNSLEEKFGIQAAIDKFIDSIK